MNRTRQNQAALYPGPNQLFRKQFPGVPLSSEVSRLVYADEPEIKLEYLARDIADAIGLYGTMTRSLLSDQSRSVKTIGDLAKTEFQVLPLKNDGSSRSMYLETQVRDELMHRLKTIKELGYESLSAILMSTLESARDDYLKARQGWQEDEKDPSLLRLASS